MGPESFGGTDMAFGLAPLRTGVAEGGPPWLNRIAKQVFERVT